MTIGKPLLKESERTELILGAPFAWCCVPEGTVTLRYASNYESTTGGTFQVKDFAIGKYLIINGQYKSFVDHPNGFRNTHWRSYSPQAMQWHKDHPHPMPPAFSDRFRTSIKQIP